MSEPPLLVERLTKRYGTKVAIDEVSLAVRPGTVHAIVGPNGAGKSSLLHCIIGTRHANGGSLRVFGEEPVAFGNGPSRVGFGGEFLGLTSASTVRNQLVALASLSMTPIDRVDELVVSCGLKQVAGQLIRKLSTGERSRVSLAVALLTPPTLLVLDEPTNGLDAEGIRWVRGVVRRHADIGGAVLLTSHLLGEVEQVADDLTVLRRRCLYSGPLSGLIGVGSLEDRYFALIEGVSTSAGLDSELSSGHET